MIQPIHFLRWLTVTLLALPVASACAPQQEERHRTDPPASDAEAQGRPAKAEDLPATENPEKADPTEWTKPRSTEHQRDRITMVGRQIANRRVRDGAVLEAMRQVPRHWFLPDDMKRYAHEDRPVDIGRGQTISQPYIVAFMTEALKLTEDNKVLEIGTGSGYQAAVLNEFTPHVYTIEIDEDLGKRAREIFDRHGYKSIKTKIGDGYQGWEEHAPFDSVIVTCAPEDIPPKLIEQLKVGGRMCIPVGSEFSVQELILAIKQEDGSLKKESLMPVRFVPMTGEARDKD